MILWAIQSLWELLHHLCGHRSLNQGAQLCFSQTWSAVRDSTCGSTTGSSFLTPDLGKHAYVSWAPAQGLSLRVDCTPRTCLLFFSCQEQLPPQGPQNLQGPTSSLPPLTTLQPRWLSLNSSKAPSCLEDLAVWTSCKPRSITLLPISLLCPLSLQPSHFSLKVLSPRGPLPAHHLHTPIHFHSVAFPTIPFQ